MCNETIFGKVFLGGSKRLGKPIFTYRSTTAEFKITRRK